MIQATDIKKVTLNDTELYRAANLGLVRALRALGEHTKPNWHDSILQASGQIALCKVLGVYWPGEPDSFELLRRGKVEVRVNSLPGGAAAPFF